ncbi:vascular cell adhesion protein 1 [Rhinoderma darwinii]|uniref:vascular cell adhesion protein 1 n=1 Tax=Rhinoderma darwinii TaxID=43563 RepID=UPI003F6754FD
MAKTSTLTIISLMLCFHIIFMHTYIVFFPIDITLSLPRITIKAQIGEELNIICKASRCSTKNPDFTWSNLVDMTLGGIVNTVEQTSTLNMIVNAHSDGSYRCTVKCDNAPGEKSFRIIVYSFPSDPILHISSLVVGQPSRITCIFPSIYPSEMLQAEIMLNENVLAELQTEESSLVTNTIQNINLTYDLTLVKEMDKTEIKCVASMNFPDDDIEPIQRQEAQSLTLMYPPEKPQIIVIPSTTVKAGEEIHLLCSTDSTSQVIQWVKKVEDAELEMPYNEQGALIFLNPNPEYSGVYICYARNSAGKRSSQVEINVQVPPKNISMAINPSGMVREGDSVQIWCTADSYPAPKLVLRWKTELGIIELDSEHGQYNISHATVEHTGTYICVASNEIGQQIEEATLTVQVPPKNISMAIKPSGMVREGDSVQIWCTADSYPAPKLVLRWKTELRFIELDSEHGQYNISHATLEHTGTYICVASNEIGQQIEEATLTVQVPPRNTNINIIPSQVVTEGDFVQIWCSSEGSPDPGLVLKLKREDGLISLELSDGFYNIIQAGMENAGEYICESSNVAGQQFAVNRLTVQIPPQDTTVVVTPSQNIKEGDTVTITRETHRIPSPSIILQTVCARNNTVLQNNNDTFTLPNVTRNDTGTYTTDINNIAGNETEFMKRQQSPRFNPTSIFIFGSVAFVSAGVIGSIIYHLKKSKLQGSYSLVKALRSKV